MYIFFTIVVIGFIGVYLWQTAIRAKNAGNAPATGSQPKQIMENISPEDARELIKKYVDDDNFVILDVRTPAEFKAGRLDNSTNLDYYAKTFQKGLDTLDKEKTYLVYCRSGNRSGKTLRFMKKLNFHKAYNMTGGISAWSRQKLPLVK